MREDHYFNFIVSELNDVIINAPNIVCPFRMSWRYTELLLAINLSFWRCHVSKHVKAVAKQWRCLCIASNESCELQE